ncbi:MAG: hypothetical protein ACPG31_08580 [Planctomycetota bacterium]
MAEGLESYLEENDFTMESYDAPKTPINLFGVRMSVPNTERHQWAIRLHDLHHVATGFGTDLRGEAEISLWEWRKGLGGLGWYVGSIVVSISLLGPLMAPRRSWKAWRAGAGERSLFGRQELEYAEILTWTIAELRSRLGVPPDGLAIGRRGLHSGAPKQQPEA